MASLSDNTEFLSILRFSMAMPLEKLTLIYMNSFDVLLVFIKHLPESVCLVLEIHCLWISQISF